MVTVTENAAKKVETLRLEEGKPEWGLRLRVVGGGCSGFSYELGWEDAAQEGDQVVEAAGVKVYVDPNSVQYVGGQRSTTSTACTAPASRSTIPTPRAVAAAVTPSRPDSPFAVGAVRVPVALFARYREAVGRGRVEVEVSERATVEDVWTALVTAHPALTRYRPHTLFAVGTDYVEPDRPVRAGEEVACFPPVSGGVA